MAVTGPPAISMEIQATTEEASEVNWNAYLESAWEDTPVEMIQPQEAPVEAVFHVQTVPQEPQELVNKKTLQFFNIQQKFIEEITAEKDTQIADLQQQNTVLLTKITSLEVELQTKKEDAELFAFKCTNVQQQADRANAIIQQFEQQKANFREKSQKLVKTLDEVKSENIRLRAKVADLQTSPLKSVVACPESFLSLPLYKPATSGEWRKNFLADPETSTYFKNAPVALQNSANFDPRFRRRFPLTGNKSNWVIIPGQDWSDTRTIVHNLQAFVKTAQFSPDPIVFEAAKFAKLLEIIITPHASAKDTLININPNLSCRKTKMDTALFLKANHLPSLLIALFEKMAETGFLINASSAYSDPKAAAQGKRRKEIYTFYQNYSHVHLLMLREGGERLLSTKMGNNDKRNKEEDVETQATEEAENAVLEAMFDLDEDDERDEDRHFKRHRT